MRFEAPSPSKPPSFRRQAWLLLVLLAATVFAMRAIRQPENVETLGKIFHLDVPAQAPAGVAAEDRDLVLDPVPPEVRLETLRTDEKPFVERLIDPDVLQLVEDNTYLRQRERAAWLAVLNAVQEASSDKLHRHSAGKVALAALIQQPEVYRGQVISVSGMVLREEELPADARDIGIESYHRLIVAPAGGGQRPFVVYSLELPPDFPRGGSLSEPVQLEAVFYKLWSYRSEAGPLELAPLVVAPTIRWSPAPKVPQGESQMPSWTRFAGGLALAGLFTWLVAWRVAAMTSRPSRSHRRGADADSTRARLADLENQ